ncbi:phosphodiesterase [Treponema pectinovorum]|uniref:phosphodiesterase n=1 Tax=Treponema pectinovorum TaxID=164 RepID=UPI0011CB37A7|nr:phosphodiesterase [Treponema pectinovorum]
MKYLVVSDIHGSEESLAKVFKNFQSEVDFIILCGDYLNHGPRNPLPEGWNPKGVAAILNEHKNRIIAVRGNCDSEVDEMVLEFPCLASYTNILDCEKRIFVHHGHLYERQKLESWLTKGTLIISGHTHITVLEESNGFFYLNPGSISLPKCEDGKTCATVEIDSQKNVKVSLYTIEKTLLRELSF